MKGLLIKDLKLMKNARNSVVLILLIAVGMSAYISDLSFIITYLGVIGITFASSTISYDEFDNGNAFLFSLPVSRKGYAIEKYLFSLLMCGGGWLIGTFVTTAVGMAKGTIEFEEGIMSALVLLPVVLCLVAFMLPLRLKFEGDKSRIAMVIVFGVFFIISVLGMKAFQKLGIDLGALEERLSVLNAGTGLAVAIAVCVALLLLSCQISIKIMEHKEF